MNKSASKHTGGGNDTSEDGKADHLHGVRDAGGLRQALRTAGDEAGSANTNSEEKGGAWQAGLGSGVGSDRRAGVAAGDALRQCGEGCQAILSAI